MSSASRAVMATAPASADIKSKQGAYDEENLVNDDQRLRSGSPSVRGISCDSVDS